MKAYTKGITKEDLVREMKAHQAADNFLKGTYDEGEKGCSVGCALKSVSKLKKIKLRFDKHLEFENHLGIPEWLARLNDSIFEGVSLERSKLWPVEFAEAINEGSDLEKVKTPILIYILKNSLESIRNAKYDQDQFPDVKKAIDQTENAVIEMIRCHENELDLTTARSAAWLAAESAERSAAWSAAESAWSAAESARSAAWSARSAAWSAARSAESAARSAARSAESAARLAARSAARSAAWSAAMSAAFEVYADKLLELIKDCK